MDRVDVARALASDVRLRILELLKDPRSNFMSQREGDLSDAGACVSVIAREVGVSQPTVSRHLEILRRAGLIDTERVAQWNFHRRDEAGIRRAQELLSDV
ncbi:MAG: ArsR/SmtB family transcription factor [Solirubrobacteraceae bacterium]